MFQYILLVISLTAFTLFAYIKLKYPFWNLQPVYHTYDYWRFLYKTPFVIRSSRPSKTKFTDLIHVQTTPFSALSTPALADVVNLLQCYYIPTDRILHMIRSDDLAALHTGGSEPSFVSIYYDRLISDASTNDVVRTNPIGCITSRPLQFFYRNPARPDTYIELPIYLTDFLCVSREHNKIQTSRRLLQTHLYHQHTQNANVVITLIKKENEPFGGVVPLVVFKTHTFHLRDIRFPPLPDKHHLLQLNSENLHYFIDFFYSKMDPEPKTELFDCFILADIGNITSQIKNGLIFGYFLMIEGEVLAFYFLKDNKMVYEDIHANTSHCIASVMNCYSADLFFSGFLHALRHLIQKHPTHTMMVMDEIGHNTFLMNAWRRKHTPVFTNDAAYYTYNFVFPSAPLNAERCLLLA